MYAGRVCLVPAAKDLGEGAIRDFRATERSKQAKLFQLMILHNIPCTLSGSKFHCKKTVQNVQTLHHYFTYLCEFYFSLVYFLREGEGGVLLTTLN